MRGKIITSLILLTAITGVILVFNAHIDKVRHQTEAAGTVNECISELLVIARVSGTVREEYDSRHEAIAASIKQFTDDNRDPDNPFSSSALQLCTDIGDLVIDNERRILSAISTAQSSRMSDTTTLKDEAEHQWRVNAIDELLAVVEIIENYEAVLIDRIRAAMVASDLPRDSKVAIFSHIKALPITQTSSQRRTVFMLQQLLLVEKELIDLLYKSREKYDVSEAGNIVFDDEALRRRFLYLADSARQSRTRLGRLGSAAFFGQKPLINSPVS